MYSLVFSACGFVLVGFKIIIIIIIMTEQRLVFAFCVCIVLMFITLILRTLKLFSGVFYLNIGGKGRKPLAGKINTMSICMINNNAKQNNTIKGSNDSYTIRITTLGGYVR